MRGGRLGVGSLAVAHVEAGRSFCYAFVSSMSAYRHHFGYAIIKRRLVPVPSVRTAHSITAKQEHFCLLITSGYTAADAYRGAYCAGKMLAPTLHREASRLRGNPLVTARITALQKGVENDMRASVAGIRERVIQDLRDEAVNASSSAVRLRALELLGRAVGLF